MTYDEAMENYGTDKPDLRIVGDMKIIHLSEQVAGSEFKVFRDALDGGGIVAALKLEGKEVTRKVIDNLTEFRRSSALAASDILSSRLKEFSHRWQSL